MKLHVDSYYCKGATHKECQDYASHNNEGKPLAVLSDGCSSAPLVDIGSRLLTRSAMMNFKNWSSNDTDIFLKQTYMSAYFAASTIHLNIDCLCATLLLLTQDENYFHAILSGDGFILAKKSDCLEVYEYKFAKGAPYYLRYGTNDWQSPDDWKLTSKRYNDYWSKFGPTVIEKTYTISNNVKIKEVAMDYNESPTFFERHFSFDEYQWVGISTDGLSSFTQLINHGTSLEQKEITIPEIVPQFADFKNLQGEFVQRRCSKAFKELTAKKWHNNDDFSLAVMTQQNDR